MLFCILYYILIRGKGLIAGLLNLRGLPQDLIWSWADAASSFAALIIGLIDCDMSVVREPTSLCVRHPP